MSNTPGVISNEIGSSESKLRNAYRNANQEVLAELCLEEGDDAWNEHISDVIVVLCASRSGSSLIFNALSSTGQAISPGGEHEPWLTLSENKFPFRRSDAIDGEIAQEKLLLKLLRNDLLVRDGNLDAERALIPMRNRLIIRRQQDLEGFAETTAQIAVRKNILSPEWDYVLRDLGKLAIKPMPTDVEQFGDPEYGLPLENPPLIDQPLAHIATDSELKRLPLLFKSPSDAYRPGFYEKLFPNARINYIHLSRGFVQTTNGLMDGWQKDDVAFISNPVGIVKPLAIEDYSITDMSKTYWCFDLFEGWEDYTESSLLEVSAEQWQRAHSNIVNNFDISNRLTFEDFYTNPDDFYKQLSDVTGIDTTNHDWSKSIMSTEPPSQMRWLKRASIFRNMNTHMPGALLRNIVELQDHLGYKMDEETWH